MCEIGVGFSFAALSVFRLRRAEAASALWIPHWHSEPFESQGTRAAKRYVNGNIVEREKGNEFGIETPASSSTIACGQQKVKGGHGSITASSITSSSASSSASIITLNLGVGCAPSCWPIFGFRNLLGARRGRRGQF